MSQKKEKLIMRTLLFLAIILVSYHLYNAVLISETPRKDYLLVGQMLLGIVTIYVPNLVKIIFKVEMPSILKKLYWLFILFAVFIGTGMNAYDRFFYWDKILHFSSAMLLAACGYALMGYFIKDSIVKEIKPMFFALFGFMFAVAIGVFWEFHEFTFDSLLEMNMQRYRAPDKTPFIGQAALYDTMSDMMFNTMGALLFSIYAYVMIKKDPLWLCENALIDCKENNV